MSLLGLRIWLSDSLSIAGLGHLGTEAWIQKHLLGYIAMLGLYILFRESMGCNTVKHISPNLLGGQLEYNANLHIQHA